MRCQFIIGLLLAVAPASAAVNRPELAISRIPDSLRNRSSAVVRDDETFIDIADLRKVRVRHSRTISLLNSDAAAEQRLIIHTSSLQRIMALRATVYDAAGNEISRISRKMFRDIPMNITGPDFSDLILKVYEVAYSSYPFTIHIEEDLTLLQTFMLPAWSQQSVTRSENVAIEKATISVTALKMAGLRYNCVAGMAAPAVSGDTLKWTFRNMPADAPEPSYAMGVNWRPSLILAVDTCSVDKFTGAVRSWKELGAFIHVLNAGRGNLTPYDSQLVRWIVDTAGDRRRIISSLYRHVQSRCRYVSVQLGIGGWQTLPATFVGKNRYGDCKGLSNYMMGLLSAAGIQSYPVVITAGYDYAPVARDFTNARFNHEILCVPGDKDTLWLECTSNQNAAGYLGNFTADRDGLMITPEGGVLVHTPRLTEADNYTRRDVSAEFVEGICKARLKATHSGMQHDALCPKVLNQSDDDLRQYANQRFPLSSYTVDRFHYELAAPRDAIPVMAEEIDFRAGGLVSRSATRYFVNMNLLPLDVPVMTAGQKRVAPIRILSSLAFEDQFEMKLPGDVAPESLPKAVSIAHDFGSFSCEIQHNGDKLLLRRRYVQRAGTYGAAAYAAFSEMLSVASAASTYKAVMIGKQK